MEASVMAMSTKHLFPDWIDRIIGDSKFEASQPQVNFLQDEGRRILWNMCMWLGCMERGVPGQACQLLERYLFIFFHERIRDVNEEGLHEKLLKQTYLSMASCVTLAAKMNDATVPLTAGNIHKILLPKDFRYSVDEIVAKEFEVFSTLGYRVPLWTSVQIGEMLAVEVGFPLVILNDVAKIVDIAEYKRHIINTQVRGVAKGSSLSSDTDNILTLHLVAGAVAAAACLVPLDDNRVAQALARLTKANTTYIKYLQDFIRKNILSLPPQRTNESHRSRCNILRKRVKRD